MCGLAGVWRREGGDSDLGPVTRQLAHRGPDGFGEWKDPSAGYAVAHRRLAILDLSPAGHQPMLSTDGRWVLAFNGEIYNHLDLRRNLESEGIGGWRGHSDTETLAAAIAHWGLRATLDRAAGMFAIALWDRRDRVLQLARDRFGEKPLFYGWTGGGDVVFGSELKALRAIAGFDNPVDPDAVSMFLRVAYVPAPLSIFRHVWKVEPGTILTLSAAALGRPQAGPPEADTTRSHGVACERYWSLDAVAAGVVDQMDEAEALTAMEKRLHEAVRLQSVADVPVGAFLSGGVDSSLIAALMRNVAGASVRTFTIGFTEAGFDEAPYARAVAKHLGTDHHELYVAPADVRGIVPDLPTVYDEPFADSSQLPTMLLSRLARTSVTVALSGDAGDEVFGGYNRYRLGDGAWAKVAQVPRQLRRGAASLLRAVPPARWDAMGRRPGIPQLGNKVQKLAAMLASPLGTRDIYRAATEEWGGAPPVASRHAAALPVEAVIARRNAAAEAMMQWDTVSYLPDDILVKVDRAAMAASLEVRVPFLDHRVVEQAWRTPLGFRIHDGEGKWLLRRILYRHVPQALIERPKAGFSIPIGAWLRGPLRDWGEALLESSALQSNSILDAGRIRQRWNEHQAGTHDWTGSLWSVLMLQAWTLAPASHEAAPR